MKLLLLLGLIIHTACSTADRKIDKSYAIEKSLSFYNPYNEDYFLSTWIRRPENIQTIHETFKTYGYSKLFSDYELQEGSCGATGFHDYINKPCNILIDSLILTHSDIASAPKYYKEFWLRRENEHNDTTVYEILKEIKAELLDNLKPPLRQELVNDTILNLIRIKREKPNTNEEALANFDYLTRIGLHGSAYNLLYERYSYSDISWNKDDLEKQLNMDTIKCCPMPIIEDDTK